MSFWNKPQYLFCSSSFGFLIPSLIPNRNNKDFFRKTFSYANETLRTCSYSYCRMFFECSLKSFKQAGNTNEHLRKHSKKKIHHKNSSLMFHLMKTVCLKDMTRLPPNFRSKFSNFPFSLKIPEFPIFISVEVKLY